MTGSQYARLVDSLAIADARVGIRHVFIRDLVVMCWIGVHAHEKEATQRVRLNLDLAVLEGDEPLGDDIGNVVCYEKITNGVRLLTQGDHVNLVETLAEDIATLCLDFDRVRSVRVRVEKLDVFEDVMSVGVEIERFTQST